MRVSFQYELSKHLPLCEIFSQLTKKHILSEQDLIFYFSFAFAKNPVAIRLTENRTIMGGITFQLSHSKYLY